MFLVLQKESKKKHVKAKARVPSKVCIGSNSWLSLVVMFKMERINP